MILRSVYIEFVDVLTLSITDVWVNLWRLHILPSYGLLVFLAVLTIIITMKDLYSAM